MMTIEDAVDATREEALCGVRAIIATGGILHSGRFSVGPFRGATVTGPTWACIVQVGPGDDVVRDDWWPVAEAFVDRVGAARAALAIRAFWARHPLTWD